MRKINKNDLLFVWCKVRVCAIYGFALTAPSLYFMNKFEGLAALLLSGIFTSITLYFTVSFEESKEANKDLSHLIMRRRHFDKIIEKEES